MGCGFRGDTIVACDRQSDEANEKVSSSTGVSNQKPIRVVTTIGMIVILFRMLEATVLMRLD